MKKTVKIIAAVLALLVLSAAVAVYALWHNELASVASFPPNPHPERPP